MEPISLKVTDPVKHIDQTTEIKNNYSQEEKDKLAKAAKDFESLITGMMLKSMTQTTGGFFGEESYGGDFFESIFENEIASQISQNKSLGIAEMLYKKITGEDLKTNFMMRPPELIPKSDKIKIDFNSNMPAVQPSSSSLKRVGKFEGLIEQASTNFGVDKNLIKSVILAESAGNEKAVSSAKAKGLMQLMDSTAKYLGVKNVWDAKENIMGGTKYLAEMLRQYNGDVKLALAGYNAGPGNVQKYNGIPPFEETKTYIARVIGYMNHLNRT
jgi:soluble lytic murein transglycosylase-like protein